MLSPCALCLSKLPVSGIIFERSYCYEKSNPQSPKWPVPFTLRLSMAQHPMRCPADSARVHSFDLSPSSVCAGGLRVANWHDRAVTVTGDVSVTRGTQGGAEWQWRGGHGSLLQHWVSKDTGHEEYGASDTISILNDRSTPWKHKVSSDR